MRCTQLSLTASAFILGSFLPAAVLLAQSPAPTPAAPLQVYSREVVVDINVADAKNIPVRGLTRDDFTVLEDGRPVLPRSFREHRSDQPQAEPGQPQPASAPNSFTNSGAPESIRPLNILLLDSLDTPVATQSILQKRLADFVDKVAAGTRIAVFSVSATGQLDLLQSFTTDRDLLKTALKSKKLNLQIPTYEDSGQEPTNEIPPDLQVDRHGNPIPPPPSAPQAIHPDVECNHAAIRGQDDTSALTQLAHYLSGMPGRKNLIWYSGGFPERMRDKSGALCYDLRADLQQADALLEHSHVVVYPVDPRALDALAQKAPDSYIVHQQSVEHLSMEAIAEDTGGKAFYNSNDLGGAAAQAMDIGGNYYTITYTPTNQNNDTRLRTLSVKVDKPDLTLIYMHGYHALPPNVMLNGQAMQRATPMQTAMMRGSLQPSEILFHVDVAPAAATEAALAPNNNADPKAMKPPYRRLTLSYQLDIRNIEFAQSPDGLFHGQFEYAVNVYDAGDGKLLNSSQMAAKPAMPLAAYQSLFTSGAKLHQEIDVPAKGDYVLRIAFHDLTTGHIGALEIPSSAVHP